MSVVVIGIEHERAPLELLERVALGDAGLAKALATLRGWDNVQEAVVLSTCLRTEVYAVVDRFHEAVEDVRTLLADRAGVPVETIAEHGAVRFDDDVAAHLFAVAAGLESAVLGEGEVLGQVRRAWERARDEQVSGPVLAELFRHAVHTGKRVRSDTAISRGTTSFAHAAVELAAGRRPGGLAGAAVAVLGAGQMGVGLVQALVARDGDLPASLTVVNRTPGRARELVALAGPGTVEASPWADLADVLAGADVVFAAVEAEAHVVAAGLVGPEGEKRPVLAIDLGVPRNIDPAAAGRPGVTLLDMDHLRAAVARAVAERRAEADGAAAIVAEEVARYRTAARERGAAPVVAALRARIETLRTAELERHRAQLESLPETAAAHVDAVTRAVLAKVLHEPSVVLREAAGTPRGERLVEALRVLFGL